jgi:acyl carrier protein
MSNGSAGSGVAAWANDSLLVRELIRKLVGELASRGSPEAQPEHTLREELGFDSIREVEITFVLEELFGFESLVIEDAPALETVGDLEDFILDMIAQGRAKVPTRSEIDRLEGLISRSARPS